MAEKVIQGVMYRQGGLLGVGQAIEIGQYVRSAVAEIEVQLAAGTELEQVQGQPPPGEEAGGVGAFLLDAAVRKVVEPGVELGEEMADGLHQGAAGNQGRPSLSFSMRARARSRATES